ncbi:MAG: efflux RND transporter periplasmic adaptor subunit [Candidatus Omnitrophica bacterium]|nr:efflux RND transporter periplasmic adaptor subunit [Candidatus Omnitrophota bacterium]
MRRTNFWIVIGLIIVAGFFMNSCDKTIKNGGSKLSRDAVKDIYFCPMHPDFTSDKPGSCSICGMSLVKKEAPQKREKKLLYYRNPMNPQVTSPVPMKDEMGMDYVPVYEEEIGQEAGVYISSAKQQLIGVKKGKVEKRHLTYEIRTVGRVAYDPELYVAQQEYIQALKVKDSTGDSSIPLVKEQMQAFLESAEQKLLLMGMGKDQILELAKQGKPQQNLYLPVNEGTVWIYITIYEYELGMIRDGLPVEIDALAFPGKVFNGKIIAVTPVLDPMTRSARVRAEVENPENKLKPEMFVNAKIQVDLGEKLAVPDSAVLDTGLRKIVYLSKEGDILESREITTGQKTQDYYEVLDGLNEGDIVITSGNFLIDSESKLKAVLKND